MALRFSQSASYVGASPSCVRSTNTFAICPHLRPRCFSSSADSNNPRSHQLILEVKEILQKEHSRLPLGPNGRDDEQMIHWFLKDRKYSVEEAVAKLSKAIRWREEFGVSELTLESVSGLYRTRKAYVHDFLDKSGRPVLVVAASRHFPAKQDSKENEKLCVFLIEKALSKLPSGKEQILGIFDLRGFNSDNADILFLKFLIDVFYYYYPKRLGQVLFVGAPFVFQPIWQVVKPWLKSYASLRRNIIVYSDSDYVVDVDEKRSMTCYVFTRGILSSGGRLLYNYQVRFCDVETVKEYFTDDTLPMDFRT